MKQQSLWEPMDGARVRDCWRALPESSRCEIVDHLARLVVRAQLALLITGRPDAVAEAGVESAIATLAQPSNSSRCCGEGDENE